MATSCVKAQIHGSAAVDISWMQIRADEVRPKS